MAAGDHGTSWTRRYRKSGHLQTTLISSKFHRVVHVMRSIFHELLTPARPSAQAAGPEGRIETGFQVRILLQMLCPRRD
jgi:hypothetical protein